MRVGFIGAGRMGAPMVRRLAEAGHQVRALGRTEDKRRAVADHGATPVAEIAAVVDGAEAVVICLLTDEQVRAVATRVGERLATDGELRARIDGLAFRLR